MSDCTTTSDTHAESKHYTLTNSMPSYIPSWGGKLGHGSPQACQQGRGSRPGGVKISKPDCQHTCKELPASGLTAEALRLFMDLLGGFDGTVEATSVASTHATSACCCCSSSRGSSWQLSAGLSSVTLIAGYTGLRRRCSIFWATYKAAARAASSSHFAISQPHRRDGARGASDRACNLSTPFPITVRSSGRVPAEAAHSQCVDCPSAHPGG